MYIESIWQPPAIELGHRVESEREPSQSLLRCCGEENALVPPSLGDIAFFHTGFLDFPRGCIVTMEPTKKLSEEIIVHIFELKNEAHGTKEVSELLKVAKTTVKKHMAQYQEGGLETSTQRHRARHPRKASSRALNIINE